MPPVCFSFERKADKSTRSVPSRQGQTFHRKVTKAARPPIIARSAKICCGSNRKRSPRAEERPQSGKGFNFVSGKLLFGWAESRFAKPRTSRKETDLFFLLVRKERGVPQRFANLWTPGTIQISARYMIVAKVTGIHQVTGNTGNCNFAAYRR